MPLHPQAALAIQRAGDLPTDLSPAELRIAYERQRLTLLPEKPAVAMTYQLSIPSDYGPIPARFYRATKDKKPCPLLVYFHGGGFMLGSAGAVRHHLPPAGGRRRLRGAVGGLSPGAGDAVSRRGAGCLCRHALGVGQCANC